MMTPQQILAQVPLLATQPFLSIVELDCGHSNQSFLVSTPEVKYVLRLDGEAQNSFNCCREFELVVLKFASAQKLSPKPIFSDIAQGVLLYTFIEGQQITQQQLTQHAVKKQFLELREEISKIGKKITISQPKQLLLGDVEISPMLENVDDFIQQQNSIKPICKQLELFSEEFCLCHNDFSPSNLMIDPESKLFAIDWEYAGNNHPLLDFAFFANNYDLENQFLQQYYPECIAHDVLDFTEIRRLAWFIEAIWYANRQLDNPSELWKELTQRALGKL
jgi:thiamine kinase-like enzyme